jgi:hypothetical protein
VSFLQKAKDAAAIAAEGAKAAASQAAGGARTLTEHAQDPETQARAKQSASSALGAAKRGVSTVVERIDPGTLAELVIKATALQEKANLALKDKGSPYRVQEIIITASIPPGVSFTIGRIGDEDVFGHHAAMDEAPAGTVSSTDLLERVRLDDETILALDGTEVTSEVLDEALDAPAGPESAGPARG